MALVRLEAILLRTYPLGDTSRIAVMYSRERGLIRAVAKGARQPKSKFAGTLEPLSRIQIVMYVKEGRELDLLSSADLLESLANAEGGLERLTYGQAASELVDKLVWGEEEHLALYELLLTTLRRIQEVPDENLGAVTIAFQLQTAAHLGYRPVLDRCVQCGREGDGWTHFAPGLGGLLCDRCAGGETLSIRLSREAVSDLHRLATWDLNEGAPAPSGRTGELLKIVEVYLQAHFQRFSGLRSLDLLRDLEAPSSGGSR